MTFREWRKAILLEEIKYTHPVQLRDDTGVITIIEILVHVDTITISVSLGLALMIDRVAYNEFVGS